MRDGPPALEGTWASSLRSLEGVRLISKLPESLNPPWVWPGDRVQLLSHQWVCRAALVTPPAWVSRLNTLVPPTPSRLGRILAMGRTLVCSGFCLHRDPLWRGTPFRTCRTRTCLGWPTPADGRATLASHPCAVTAADVGELGLD